MKFAPPHCRPPRLQDQGIVAALTSKLGKRPDVDVRFGSWLCKNADVAQAQ